MSEFKGTPHNTAKQGDLFSAPETDRPDTPEFTSVGVDAKEGGNES